MRTFDQAAPESLTAESESLSLAATDEVYAVSLVGRLSSAQVHFVGPDAWLDGSVVIRLYGRFGGGRVLLSEASLQSTLYTQENGTTSALAVFVQNVHVEGFEVVLAQTGGREMTGGRILLVGSHRAQGPDIRPGLSERLQPPVAQGAPAGLSGRWPVLLTDGAQEIATTTNALHVRRSDRRAAYFTSATVGTGTAASTKSILYVWNGHSGKRAEIRRVTIAYLAGAGSTTVTLRGTRITAQASPAGGTGVSPAAFDPTDGGSSLTSVAGGSSPTAVGVDVILFAVPIASTGTFVWTWSDLGKPIVLPAESDQGFEIRAVLSGTTASQEMKLHVSVEWLEI